MARYCNCIKKSVGQLIRGYRTCISPLFGHVCRFYPSCSEYAEHCVYEFGIMRGIVLSLCRLAKCHPWHAGGFDPVPSKDKE